MRTCLYSLLVFLVLPLFVSSQTRGKIESIRLYEKDFVLLGEGRRGPYFLPDSLILENSASVFLNNQPIPESDYQIDYIRGELRFFESVPQNMEIRVIYKVFPYELQTSYSHREILHRVFGASTEDTDLHTQTTAAPEEDYAANLSKSGSITRGVTVGSNRGLKVNSALNINVSGKVGDNVEVVAALTDQTTPIQPEGTTQNLQEIDKVFIQIKSPSLAATMGDFNINYTETQFANYNRKLQGAMGEANYEHLNARVSAAVSRGKYHSMQFLGQEGNQGPYQLKGDRGQIDIIVLAGTERVFIDGELMIRGESNDYIIDYSAAQITFTRHRLITSDSRITVDFQYSDEQYRRNLYSAAVGGSLWDDRLRISGVYLHEADDKNNPLDFTLTDDYRQILENAGDSQRAAVINGATYVGPESGRYNFVDSVYVFVGDNMGEYNVTFSDVGEGEGSYQYKGNAVFEYVGEGAARYAPVILLPLPKSHDVVDLSLDLAPFKALTLHSELAVSNYDRNSFSTLDSEDNIGVAQDYQVALRPEKLNAFGRNLGNFFLTGRYKKVGDQFTDIDRTTEIEYNRKWDLPSSATREETVKEIYSQYEPFQGFTIGGEWGSIQKGSYFRSNRWLAENRYQSDKLPSYNYRIEHINKNNIAQNQLGDWLRQRGNADWSIWKFRPLFEYEGEIKKENWSDSLYTGFKFDDISGGLEFQPFSKFSITGRVSQRDDQEYVGYDTFVDKSFANTQNLQLELQQIKSFSASLDLTHRTKTYATAEQADTRTDLAELRTQWTPWKRAINANWTYQISNTATARKERVYIKVPEGEGNYRFDDELNEYVYDPLGDHILRILTTDQLIPTIELKTSSRLRLEPSRLFENVSRSENSQNLWVKAISAVSSESYLALEERTQSNDMRDIYLMNLQKFRDQEHTIFGYLQYRQDVYLFERSRDFSVRLRYHTRDELNNQYLEGGEERNEWERSARVTARISDRVSTQSELLQKRTARFFNQQNRQDRDIQATELDADISFVPQPLLKLALEGRLSWEEDTVYEQPTQVQAYALIPRVTYSLRNKGRIRAEFEWSYVDANPKDRVLPYEMANGRSIGQSIRWDLRFDYRISSVIQATLSYAGRNEPERDRVIHTGRAQVTAAFR